MIWTWNKARTWADCIERGRRLRVGYCRGSWAGAWSVSLYTGRPGRWRRVQAFTAGPFDTADAAIEWAEALGHGRWVTPEHRRTVERHMSDGQRLTGGGTVLAMVGDDGVGR